MKINSKNPVIKDGVEYPYLAVSLAMSPLWKPNLGASVAIRFTPFRELQDGTYESLTDEPKAISLLDIFETAQGDPAFEDAIQGMLKTLQDLVDKKEL
jgi:hypothetical protein